MFMRMCYLQDNDVCTQDAVEYILYVKYSLKCYCPLVIGAHCATEYSMYCVLGLMRILQVMLYYYSMTYVVRILNCAIY